MSNDTPRPRGRPGIAGETRERLVQAALEVFLERGYADTRVQDITKAAGYTTGALYAHFGGRMEVLAEAIMGEGSRLVDSVTTVVENAPLGEGGAAQRLADAIVEDPREFDPLMLEAFALAARDAAARDMLGPAIDQVRARLADLVDNGIELEVFDATTDRGAMTTVLTTLVLGSILVRALGIGDADRDDLAAILYRVSGKRLDGSGAD